MTCPMACSQKGAERGFEARPFQGPLGRGSSGRDRRRPPEPRLAVGPSSPAGREVAPITSSGPCLSLQPDFQGITLVSCPPEALDLIFSAAQHSNAAIKEMVSSPVLGGGCGGPWGPASSFLLLSASPAHPALCTRPSLVPHPSPPHPLSQKVGPARD